MGQLSDNSARWLVADQGIMLNAAASAVRGASASSPELAHVMECSGCMGLIVQDAAVLEKVAPYLHAQGQKVRFVVLLWGDVDLTLRQRAGVPVLTYEDVRLPDHVRAAACRSTAALHLSATRAPACRDVVAGSCDE